MREPIPPSHRMTLTQEAGSVNATGVGQVDKANNTPTVSCDVDASSESDPAAGTSMLGRNWLTASNEGDEPSSSGSSSISQHDDDGMDDSSAGASSASGSNHVPEGESREVL
jgi:hypothetical protein